MCHATCLAPAVGEAANCKAASANIPRGLGPLGYGRRVRPSQLQGHRLPLLGVRRRCRRNPDPTKAGRFSPKCFGPIM